MELLHFSVDHQGQTYYMKDNVNGLSTWENTSESSKSAVIKEMQAFGLCSTDEDNLIDFEDDDSAPEWTDGCKNLYNYLDANSRWLGADYDADEGNMGDNLLDPINTYDPFGSTENPNLFSRFNYGELSNFFNKIDSDNNSDISEDEFNSWKNKQLAAGNDVQDITYEDLMQFREYAAYQYVSRDTNSGDTSSDSDPLAEQEEHFVEDDVTWLGDPPAAAEGGLDDDPINTYNPFY